MGAVAAGTVGHLDDAPAGSQAVVTVGKRLRPVVREVPLLRDLHRRVAGGADARGNVGRRHRRLRVLRREDAVLPVAVRAGRRVLVSLVEGHSVDARVVQAALGLVTTPADLFDPHLVDRRGGIEAVPGVVGPVTVDAGRGTGVAARQRRAVNAVLVRGDEAHGRPGSVPHGLVAQVARETEPLLGHLQGGGVGDRALRDREMVAGQAGRRAERARRERPAVLGRAQARGRLAMAAAAGLGLSRRGEAKRRILHRDDFVGPVAGGAGDLGLALARGGAADRGVERVRGTGAVVAARAGDRRQALLVREVRGLGEVRVAVHAGEARGSVDRGGELALGDGDRSPVGPLGGRIPVAGQAVGVGRGFDRRGRGEGPGEEAERCQKKDADRFARGPAVRRAGPEVSAAGSLGRRPPWHDYFLSTG